MLEVFTCASLPAQNPITSIFKVRCLAATGFFKWLITLATNTILPETAAKAAGPYIPRLKDVGFACITVTCNRSRKQLKQPIPVDPLVRVAVRSTLSYYIRVSDPSSSSHFYQVGRPLTNGPCLPCPDWVLMEAVPTLWGSL